MLDALPTNALVVTALAQDNYVRYDVMAGAAADSPIVRATRFSELSALHDAITKEMPNFQGELPRKTFRHFTWKDAAFIEGRRADIEQYLREAATHARQSTSFREFFASGLTDCGSEAVDAEVSVSTAMPAAVPVPFVLRPSVGTWLTQPSMRPRHTQEHGANESVLDAAESKLHSGCISAPTSLPVASPTRSLVVKAVTQHDVVMYEVMEDSSPDSRVLKSTRYSELSELHSLIKQEIPDFPGKLPWKTLRYNSDSAFIETRRAGIEVYLREAAEHARHSIAFREFFNICDESADAANQESAHAEDILFEATGLEDAHCEHRARTDSSAIDAHAALPTTSLIVKARIEQNLVKYDVLADASKGSPVLKSTRFSELSDLHSILKQELGAFPWELPRKTIRQHHDAAFIEARRADIELYLRRVAAHSWQSKAFRAFFKECDDAVRKKIRLLKCAVIFAQTAYATASELNDSATTAANEAIEYSSQLTMDAAKTMRELLSLEGMTKELSADLDRATHAHRTAEVKARLAHAACVDHERDAERMAEIMAEAKTEMTTTATKQLKVRTASDGSQAILLKCAAEEASIELEQTADQVASVKELFEECTSEWKLASAVHARAAAAAQEAAREADILKERSGQCAATLESRLAELTTAKQAVLAAQNSQGVQASPKPSPVLGRKVNTKFTLSGPTSPKSSEDTTDSAGDTADSDCTSEFSSDLVTSHLDKPAPLDAYGLAALAL
jgi:hypothetical protein